MTNDVKFEAKADLPRVGDSVPFSDLCKLLEDCSKPNRPMQIRREKLCKFITLWRSAHEKLHSTDQTDDSFFDAMRLLLPALDRDRGAYGFKEDKLADKILSTFGFAKASDIGQKLKKWKGPSSGRDFGEHVAEIISMHVSSRSSLTLTQVNCSLDKLAYANIEGGDKGKRLQTEEFVNLVRSCNAVSIKWLLRILLKQMKSGLSEKLVLSEWHKDANRLFDVTTSLQKVCQRLRDPKVTLDEIEVELFMPFRPMLADRATPSQTPALMNNVNFYIETKYDGERIQVHKNGNEYKYFSRNGNESTSALGAGPGQGSVTPRIHKLLNADSCILDGELLAWNANIEKFWTKTEGINAKTLLGDADIRPCLVIFDCLHYNGRVLTSVPLQERIKIIDQIIIAEEPGTLMKVKRHMANSKQEVMNALNDAIERRDEGIVAKRPDSLYKLNVRNKIEGWLKIKPDYVNEVTDDEDLLIVGGYFGKDRHDLLSHFLLALADDMPDDCDEKGLQRTFTSVCKVGSGYTMKELWELNVALNNGAIPGGRNAQVPVWLNIGSVDKPDIYIEPHHSSILQVRSAEIAPSNRFPLGHTLRFPRVVKVRSDKQWHEATTVSRFLERQKEGYNQVLMNDVNENEKKEEIPKKKRKVQQSTKAAVADDQKPIANSTIINNGALSQKTVAIICSKAAVQKKMEMLAHSLGATVVMHDTLNTYCVVADTLKQMRIKGIRESLDILSTAWLKRVADRNALICPLPVEVLRASPETEQSLRNDYDKFGDSYTIQVTGDEVRAIIDNNDFYLSSEPDISRQEIGTEIGYEFSKFSNCTIYVDRFRELSRRDTAISMHPLEVTELKLKVFGAEMTTIIDESTTHVLSHSSDSERLAKINDINRMRERKFYVIDESFANGEE